MAARSPVAGLMAGIKRPILTLGLVSFFTDVSSEMIYPLIPRFLTVTLGVPVAVLGLIEGIAEGTASLLKTPSGWLSDRLGRRRPLVFAGYGLSALGKLLLAVAMGWPLALVARFVDRAGKGLRTAPRDALIADLTEPAYRGKAFGLHRAMDTAGAVAGPLAAYGLLVLFQEDLRRLFLIAILPAVVGLLLVRAVREPGPRPMPAQGSAAREPAASGSLGWQFKAFVLVNLVFALGNSSDAFLLLRAADRGLGTGAVVLAYVLYNGVYSLLSTPAGVLSDRLGRRSVMLAGFVLFALVYLGFAAAPGAGAVWGLFALYGLYMAMTEGVGRALASDLAPPGALGRALGLYHTGIGVMALLASIMAGLLWEQVGRAAPFYLGGATAALAALLLLALVRGGAPGYPPRARATTS